MSARKAVFDSFRLFLGKPLNQSQVEALDDFLDSYKPPKAMTTLAASAACLDLIKRFEGCHKMRADGRVEAYLCPAGVWTIGYGSTGADIAKGMIWTLAQCEARFREHVGQFEEAVRRMVGQNATQGQFDALVSFAYNIGADALRRSTLLRKHNEGDYAGAADEFAKWNKGGGKVLAGLTKRRAAESALYRSGL